MALKKESVIDLIAISENGAISVRRATYVLEDGVRITEPRYHRVSYVPGADVSGEDARVQAHAATAWTLEVVAAHLEQVARAAAQFVKFGA